VQDVQTVEAGVLALSYLEDGPPGGWPVIATHGFPFDVHARRRTRLNRGWPAPLLAGVQAWAMLRPGIGSARSARQAGAPNGSAKYCVSWATCSCANSITLTE
jgi:hypothetical protein